jgi:hypothetical protein
VPAAGATWTTFFCVDAPARPHVGSAAMKQSVGTWVGLIASLALIAGVAACANGGDNGRVDAAIIIDFPDGAPRIDGASGHIDGSIDASDENAAPVLNEYRANNPGGDTMEFVEIVGAPDTDYGGYSIVQIDGDCVADCQAGHVDTVFSVGTTDQNGFWVTDFMANKVENNTLTLLLVAGFTGAADDDLDTDDDGTLDSHPWDAIADQVSNDDGTTGDKTYAEPVLDNVLGASRIPDRTGDWAFNGDGGAVDTPGASNHM